MHSVKAETTLFPYGAATLAEVTNIIRTQCTNEDVLNLEAIISQWREASKYFLEISKKELDATETIDVREIHASYQAKLDSITSDSLFKRSFSVLPVEFKLVEIGKLVAPQRLVNLDYVEQLKVILPKDPSLDDLIDFCLLPKKTPPRPKEMQLAQNVFAYSSPSSDFRFLGGFTKPLTEEDIRASTGGGLPVAALVLLVGYGSPTCNTLLVGNRMILNNGFHRMYSLADMGIKHAPVLVQKVTNPDLEFPSQVAGLPKDYLIGHRRPVLMKDFLDKKLVRIIHRKPRMMSVQIGWNCQQSFVPI